MSTSREGSFSGSRFKLENLAEGTVLRGPFWPEPVRVLTTKLRGDRIEVKAVGTKSQKFYPLVVSVSEFLEKVEIEAVGIAPTFSEDASKFKLALEAIRIRLAYEYDPHFAVSVSQVDAVPHQIEAIYHHLLKKPKIRFLLADDAGAGKTIMAGLLLKELKYRGMVERVLIVTPAYLTDQWRRELYEKFGEEFEVVDRPFLKDFYGRSAWEKHNQIITSMDFAKRDEILDSLKDARWDLVIVDEAHKMAAYRYGKKLKKTMRRWLGEVLSERTDHFLFLTATPHKGDPDNFLLLLQLLDRDLFSNTRILQEAVRQGENPIFLRRLKEDMRGFDGRPLFPPRHVHTVTYELSGPEKELYDNVTEYVVNQFNRALKEDERNIAFALMILQRRLASSIRAIKKSLERRRGRLLDLKKLVSPKPPHGIQAGYDEKGRPVVIFSEGNHLTEIHFGRGAKSKEVKPEEVLARNRMIEIPEDIEDLTEAKRWEYEEKFEALTLAANVEELEGEIREIERLIKLAEEVEKKGTERKLEELHNVIQAKGIKDTGEKLLVFTEHKDTLDYLIENLRKWGFRVTYIHGNMPFEKRREAERKFSEKAQVMVATEAAGEGINLQFCSLMINYDVPWNPTRLEQRMGRIHRYGQRNEVHIYNLIASNTREGAVLGRILEKLELMRKHLGRERVYDVIGKLFEGRRLDELVVEAITKRRSMNEIYQIIDATVDEKNIELIKEAALEGLATRFIDLSAIQEEMEQAKEQRLVPEYIERFFTEAFQFIGGKMERRADGYWRIDHVPIKLRRPQKGAPKFGRVNNEYPKITFYKDQANRPDVDFIAPGHPLFEVVIQTIVENLSDVLQKGAVFLDPDQRLEGLLWFVKGGIQDGSGATIGERIFVIHQAPDGGIHERGAFLLHDLKTPGSSIDAPSYVGGLYARRDEVIDWALEHALPTYYEEIKGKRLREAEIKEKYLKRSMNALISESIAKLSEYRRKESMGKDMAMAIRMEEARLEELKERQGRRLQEIEQEKHLMLTSPEIIGVACVLPLKLEKRRVKDIMVRDEEVEAIAIRVAMEYERKNGRIPEDVSWKNLGFDIRSKGNSEVRYIEVKGRARAGSVVLTPNEWIKAQRLGNQYWLYIVVTDGKNGPKLYAIKDPASKLKPVEEVEIVRYLVPADHWRGVAELEEVAT